MNLAPLVLSLLYTCSSVAQSPEAPRPVVKTASGLVRGIIDSGIAVFKGIPYAAPPTGANRWRPPQPVTAWPGERDASQFGAECAHAGFGTGPGTIAANSAEDCLFLNIWLPAGTQPGTKLPVMVWIHGGAFVFGSGSQPEFAGNEFARQGIILVTFNYRLGRLGFFAFPALNEEHPEEPKGNYAYMDQLAALQWVKRNIAAFGGNPGNVTIFGESAGGVSVQSLLTIPAARGLFHKGIIESGGGRDGVLTGRPILQDSVDKHYPVSATSIGVNFARKHGIQQTDVAALARLRALPVADIVDGGQETAGPGGPPIYSGPILDGKLVVETAQHAYEIGHQQPIPIIIGSNSAEVPGGFVNARSKEDLLNWFGAVRDEAKAVYDPGDTSALPRMLTLANTDYVWAEPARFTARAYAKIATPAYIYLFSYVSPGLRGMMRFGAGHGSEIPYVFNNLRPFNGAAIADQDRQVASLMNRYWANFARTGNPNGKGLPNWPISDPQKNEILEITPDGAAVGKVDPRKARLDVMEKATKAH